MIFNDNDLGVVALKKNIRARNYTISIKGGKVIVTLPFYGSYKRALGFLLEHKEQVREKLLKQKEKLLPSTDEAELRQRAKAFLPGKLHYLASQHGFHYSSVKIRKSRTRWGSCSSKAAINLSFYLMLLPEHLSDYVLLHELCHTVYMNHGHDFWQLLDNVTNNQAKALRKELKNHPIPY